MANELVFLRGWADPTMVGTLPLVFNLDQPNPLDGAGRVEAGGIHVELYSEFSLAALVRVGGVHVEAYHEFALAGQVEAGGIHVELIHFFDLAGTVTGGAGAVWGWSLDVPDGIASPAGVGWTIETPAWIEMTVGWDSSGPVGRQTAPGFNGGQPIDVGYRVAWVGSPERAWRSAALALESDSAKILAGIGLRLDAMPARPIAGDRLAWQSPERAAAGRNLDWQHPPTRIAGHGLGLNEGRPAGAAIPIGFIEGRPARAIARPAWRDGGPLPPGRTIVILPEPPEPPVFPFGRLRFYRLAPVGRLIFARESGAKWPILIPQQRVYYVLHDISVVRLPDRITIPSGPMTLSADADSYDITFQGTLYGRAALEAVRPASDGSPVLLEVAIDGHTWQIVVERWRHSRGAKSRAISIEGRSLSALLGKAYVLPRSTTSTNALNLAQLAEAELPLAGWTLNWQATDWAIPAGVWTYANLTPIEAITEAATAAGAMVIPATAAQALTIKPRYPTLPWATGATPDISIPGTAVFGLEMRYAPPPQANAIFVHGRQQGLLARVYRSGTAGDAALPAVDNPFITHVDGARALGERLLAGAYLQPELSAFSMPLGGVFPLLQIGQLAEIDSTEYSGTGTVSAVQVAVQKVRRGYRVVQNIKLGEDTGNDAIRFQSLVPGSPVLSGVVASVGSGTAVVTLVGGANVTVIGSGANVGDSVYLQGGRILGSAPALTGVEIEV